MDGQTGPSGTGWLAGLKFDQVAHHLVLEDYIEAVEAPRRGVID